MARCSSTRNLEVHHKRRDGGNGLDNAMVLCQQCHANTSSYGVSGPSPAPFTLEIKEKALRAAGNRCECTKDNCHS